MENITLCKIPVHVGIKDNETSNKEVPDIPEMTTKLPIVIQKLFNGKESWIPPIKFIPSNFVSKNGKCP